MANEFNEAAGLQMSALFALALVLFLANFLALALAKYILRAKA
jgi:ABC-type phosphate transport system permease subunit